MRRKDRSLSDERLPSAFANESKLHIWIFLLLQNPTSPTENSAPFEHCMRTKQNLAVPAIDNEGLPITSLYEGSAVQFFVHIEMDGVRHGRGTLMAARVIES